MNSPLPAYYEEPVTETDKPIETQTIEQDNSFAPEPYPKRTGRGFATLPNVTLKQHRIAAIAGGVVTLFAVGGFGVLLAFAPRADNVHGIEAPIPQTAAAQPAAMAPEAAEPVSANPEETIPVKSVKTVTIKPAEDLAAAKADVLAGVAAASADPAAATEPAPAVITPEALDQTATASVVSLPDASPRWGNSIEAAEQKAEVLASETVTAALSSGAARTPPGPDASAEAAPQPAAPDAQAAVPAPEKNATPAHAEPAVAKPKQEDASKPDAATTAAIAKPEPVSAATARPGRVNKHVNLRSGPNDESKVLRVVPAKASLSIINCESWCEVVYEGTRGYVYKSFVK
ncbi:MAG TPA: SH3 domain-containing protein [Rhizobiaceae bacterium]|nr:SH3 domain-containing protein [Rhizobiaceae bacterium]